MGKKLHRIIVGLMWLVPGFLYGQTLGEEFLSVSLDGRTRVVVTDPQGDRVGSHGREVWNESTNTEQSLVYGSQSIAYTSPLEGTYQLDFKGNYSEDYGLTVSYYDGEKYQEVSTRRWSKQGEVSQMNIHLEMVSDRYVLSSPEVHQPEGRATLSAGHAQLHWSAVPGSSEYRVYYKYWDYPYFAPLLSTSATSTLTGLDWATDSGDPLRPSGLYYFVVTAVLENGNETIFSPIFDNADQDNDGYNDFREIDLGTDPHKSDTDEDGIDDFLEQNKYHTNPLVSDTDGDSFTDGDEVEQGTLPNHADSYPGRVEECAAPESGDWHISSDCSVVENQNIPQDLIVHPNSLLTVRENITMLFDYVQHKILVMFGAGIKLQPGAQIKQK